MKFRRFIFLTVGASLVFALTMTFAPLFPAWANYAVTGIFLIVCGALWWVARARQKLSPFRPVFFAYFASVVGISVPFYLTDGGLRLVGLSTQTPKGVAVAKLFQASLTIAGILATARLCGEDLASLYIRKGRLFLSLSVGLIAAAALFVLTMHQTAVTALSTSKLASLAPWIALFVVPNALMEELLFRGLFLGRYEPIVGQGLAVLSTALAFALAHLQVTYTAGMPGFLLATFALAVAWAWLMQRTANLWGSALFHAGADMLIIVPIFAGFGAL